jgi:FAD/FMN-containing dehydrogenase
MQAIAAQALEQSLAADAALAQSLSQSRALWALRELISEAQAAEGKNIKHDIAVPISSIARFVAQTDALIAQSVPRARMVVFGHLGDGNLHYNVSPPEGMLEDEFLARQPEVYRLVHDQVARFAGSISAEHGIGQLKRDENRRYKSQVELSLMRDIKQAIDPLGIMNPGKVLP